MAEQRSIGKRHIAHALWYTGPGAVELRTEQVATLPNHATVRTLYSAISRGTERLVLNNQIAASEYERMRAPLQQGEFPFPVKYGYSATGIVIDGPDCLRDRHVFCLHPHQDVFSAPVTMLAPFPAELPPQRATLAANMETALNAHWDAGTSPGDRIVVIGAGIVGLLTAFIAQKIPGTDVTLIDVDPEKQPVAKQLGLQMKPPADTPTDADIIFHTSATSAGLATAINCAGFEAAIVELSWYGREEATLPLGGTFHSNRLRLISSQVGHVAPSHRPRWSRGRRLAKALQLLQNPELDVLVNDQISFADTPAQLPAILAPDARGLPPLIAYPSSA